MFYFPSDFDLPLSAQKANLWQTECATLLCMCILTF